MSRFSNQRLEAEYAKQRDKQLAWLDGQAFLCGCLIYLGGLAAMVLRHGR